jgi:GT2 family glycosyltransferase
MKKCTAIIKTFLRDDYFYECYNSLKKTYPEIKALVADSGNDSEEKTKFIKKNKINYTKLPFDSGICIGRNTLVKKVRTKYVLIGDDDFKYTKDAMVQEMIDFLEAHPEYDLVGGRVKEGGRVRDYQGFMNIDGRTFNFEKLELKNYEHCDKSGLDYKPCDITFNFFVAKTKAVKQVLWDEKIKVRYEHSSFFMDFKSAGHKVAFSPNPIVIHKPEGIKTSKEYTGYRQRFNDNKVFFNRFDVERVVDMNNIVAVFDAEGYSDIAFLIKTIERYDCLERLLFSIVKYYPNANIFIADDGKHFNVPYYTDLWKRLFEAGLTKKPTAYNIEYDSGLSYSRNFLVKSVRDKFKYLLILDDDFEFTEETKIKKMKELLEGDLTLGLVGGVVSDDGKMDRHFEHNFEIIGETLYHRADKEAMKKINGIEYKIVECVLNFCLINNSLTYSVLWDDKIKIQGEHTDFFLRLKETPWKVAYCPEVRVNHFTKLDPEYKKKRKRNEFLIYMMKKHNIKKIEYLNGFKYELSELELLTKSNNI